MDSNTNVDIVHWLWTGTITAVGAIMAFFTKRTVDAIDQKADKEDVVTLRNDFNALLARQDQQHRDNTSRLDTIIMELGRRGNGQ